VIEALRLGAASGFILSPVDNVREDNSPTPGRTPINSLTPGKNIARDFL